MKSLVKMRDLERIHVSGVNEDPELFQDSRISIGRGSCDIVVLCTDNIISALTVLHATFLACVTYKRQPRSTDSAIMLIDMLLLVIDCESAAQVTVRTHNERLA